jgi:DNA-binding MarR family transcriptional regulator
LAQHLGRDKAQLARLVKSLRDLGLLGAQVDEADARSVKLSLTKAGKSVWVELQRQAERLSDQAVDGLSPTERALLTTLLQRVSNNLDAADADE